MKYLTIILLTVLGTLDAIAADTNLTKIDTVIVEIKGTDTDARFDPVIIEVNTGDVIQFIVREGIHTVTAYHPDNRRPQRIPTSAQSFNSGLMKKGDQWFLTISTEGIYDYFCLPHEKVGHVGRIITGAIDTTLNYPDENMPAVVVQKLNSEMEKFLNQ
ncbi:cupredoxin domain-containing protein [Fodinibius sp. Rm-B-1B1-1]|uniref:cupredoxin domain-containing protein n=1 Tax=Fodinibius alkaliphilus TaxID=3140241 RepID=UPI003159F14E